MESKSILSKIIIVTCILISSCVVSQITCKLEILSPFQVLLIYFVLYSFINLTILDQFLHSIEIAFFLFTLFFLFLLCVHCILCLSLLEH